MLLFKKKKEDGDIVSNVWRAWQVSWTFREYRKQLKGVKRHKEGTEWFLYATLHHKDVVDILYFSNNVDETLSDYWIRESKAWMLE